MKNKEYLYRVGDKVLCINDNFFKKDLGNLKKNTIYTVYGIHTYDGGLRIKELGNVPYLRHRFISLNEWRKKKLKKIINGNDRNN